MGQPVRDCREHFVENTATSHNYKKYVETSKLPFLGPAVIITMTDYLSSFVGQTLCLYQGKV